MVGGQNFFIRFCRCNEAEWSEQSEQILAGVQGPCIFNYQLCIFPIFLIVLLQVLQCALQNMYFNMKYSVHFDKCNFPFLYLRKSSFLFVHLAQFGVTSIFKLGVRGLLRAPEAIALLSVRYAFSHIIWYFSSKKLTYIYVGTLQNIYFNTRDSWHFDKCFSKLV